MLTSIRNARLIFHTKKKHFNSPFALERYNAVSTDQCFPPGPGVLCVGGDGWLGTRRGSSTLVRSLHGVITQKAVQLIPSIGDSKCLLFTTSFISEHQKIH